MLFATHSHSRRARDETKIFIPIMNQTLQSLANYASSAERNRCYRFPHFRF